MHTVFKADDAKRCTLLNHKLLSMLRIVHIARETIAAVGEKH